MRHGQFTWFELMTTDTAAAERFYASTFRWGSHRPPGSPIPYTLFTVADAPVAGMMDLPEEAARTGVPPNWLGYVAVDDVDASTAKAVALGGKVYCEPRDVPDVCRFACVGDPQGAAIGLMRWTQPRPEQAPAIGWHELLTSDWRADFDFYAALFGWQKAEAIDMGPMGTYQLFSAGGPPVGGMMNRPPEVPVSAWIFYMIVPEVDAALARVSAGGGKTCNGPMQVPGGSWVAQCQDSQGAMFAVVGPKR